MEQWIKSADLALYGPDGDNGLIREHQDEHTRKKQQKEKDEQSAAKWARYSTFLVAIPVLMRLWDFAQAHHWFG